MKRRGGAGTGDTSNARVLRSRSVFLAVKGNGESSSRGAAPVSARGVKSKASSSSTSNSGVPGRLQAPNSSSSSSSNSSNNNNSNSSSGSRNGGGSNGGVSSTISADFRSCLEEDNIENDHYVDSSPKGMRPILLRRALSIRELDNESWLSSSLIDLVISKFSKSYPNTHFMSIDFVVLHLSSKNKSELELATDISGKRLNYLDPYMPIVFVCNSKDIHWNLIRVIRYPKPELQLFEPMGKPENRHGGLGYRDVPRCVIDWLNTCIPLQNNKSWLTAGVSAITIRQQLNHFDCGTAVLLYAEKCGQGVKAEDINDHTTQNDISEYRKLLQDFVCRVDALE